MGGVCALHVAHLGVYKCPSIVSLKALSCLLVIGAKRVADGDLICH